MSVRQTQNYLAELERHGLIRRIGRFAGRAQSSNAFQFLWHQLLEERVQNPAPGGVKDPAPEGVKDRAPKDSQIEESQIKENPSIEGFVEDATHWQADYRFASPDAGEDSRALNKVSRKQIEQPQNSKADISSTTAGARFARDDPPMSLHFSIQARRGFSWIYSLPSEVPHSESVRPGTANDR